MEILDGSRPIHIEGYQSLDPEADRAFEQLFRGFFSDPSADFQRLLQEHLPPFEQAMLAYFDRNAQSNPLQDRFFTNLTTVWKRYFDQGRLTEAKGFWNRIVSTTRSWEDRTGHRVHKGSALYFWAVTAITQGEIDKGFLLMHTALEEDILTQNVPLPRTPSLMFATLDFSETRQFFYPFVRQMADFLNTFFQPYRDLTGSKLTLEDFRLRFLNHPPSAHAVFSFALSLARLHLLNRLPAYSLSSQFAGQYEIAVLSDLALVVDEAVAFKHPTQWKFVDLTAFLAASAQLNLSKADLSSANAAMDASFDNALTALLDGTYRFPDGNARHRIECDITVCYCIRNHGAHNLASFPAVSSRFHELRQSFLNVVFLTVESLY